MTSITLNPQARIAALVGVVVIALGGAAFFFMQGNSQAQTLTTPTPAQTQPSLPVHVVKPTVNPLLPAPLRAALERDSIVVVAFSDPHSAVSGHTVSEARAGAEAAHVGFLAVNLLDDSVAGPLTALLPSGELLPNPGVAIYTRKGTILYRSDGYLAQEGVVQAVRGAK